MLWNFYRVNRFMVSTKYFVFRASLRLYFSHPYVSILIFKANLGFISTDRQRSKGGPFVMLNFLYYLI